MKGIIYTRVSSDEQIKGTSLESQEKACRLYCRERNIEVLGVYREEGSSAKSTERAEFLRAIEFCRKHKGGVQAFVVWKVDRFARNTEDHFFVRKVLLDYGVSLHSVTEPIGNNPAEKFVETVLAGSAEFDNAIRRQRSMDGMVARINQGIYPWKPPIGYLPLNTKRRGMKKTEPDLPDQETFPIIQKALKEYSRGLASQTELAGMLDKWGLKEIRKQKTYTQLVDRLLGRYLAFYAGIIINPWNGAEVQGLHKPMITRDEYFQIKLVRSGKHLNNVNRRKLNPDFPLRKTVLCHKCGEPLTGSCSRGNGGSYYYYHCRSKECSMYGKAIKKKDVEDGFVELLNEITPKGTFFKVLKATVVDLWKEKAKDFETDAGKFKKAVERLEQKRKRIFEMREDGSYTKEEFQERKKEVENEIMTSTISLNESKIEQFDLEGAISYAEQFVCNLGRQWSDLGIHTQVRFQKMVFPEGISYQKGEGFGTAKLGVIYELNRGFSGEKSQLVAPRGIEPLFTG